MKKTDIIGLIILIILIKRETAKNDALLCKELEDIQNLLDEEQLILERYSKIIKNQNLYIQELLERLYRLQRLQHNTAGSKRWPFSKN